MHAVSAQTIHDTAETQLVGQGTSSLPTAAWRAAEVPL